MSKLQLIFVSLFLAISVSSFSQVGIGTNTPNASAALDITSNTSGFLPPRMTEEQRNEISDPASGLIVFCTDCGAAEGEFQIKLASGWKNITGGDEARSLINTSDEPAGVNCNVGGTKIEVGKDTNKNNILENDEVDDTLTRYVCNGEDGVVSGLNSPLLTLECVDMGIALNCIGNGLNSEASLTASDSYTYKISRNNIMDDDGFTISPQWRKFKISGLQLNPGDRLLFKHNYEEISNISYLPDTSSFILTPEISNGHVYFYFYAEMLATNGTYSDSHCIKFENFNIPQEHSKRVSVMMGDYRANWYYKKGEFQVFYEKNNSYVFTGIVFTTSDF
jgi:hypothetical protein